MSPCLVHASKSFRILFILALASLLPAWTCSAIVQFNGCTDAIAQPQIAAVSPQSIPADTSSVLLTVNGSAFVSQSEILWNGKPLQTTFLDSSHLQAAITQQTFASFGGSSGSNVSISVNTPSSNSFADCADGGTSTSLTLVID